MNRIAYLDMLRGYALICIMLDHMPLGVLRQVTLARFALFDAAELFVLLSGFLVGMVWIKVEARQSRRAVQRRFALRAFQVWRALVVGGVLMALLSRGLFALELNHTAIWFEYARWIGDHPIGYVVSLGLLWMQPNLLDVLALYVVLLASAPVLVPLLLRWPWRFALGSALVWLLLPPLNALLPNQRVDQGMLFNPFGWQALFYAGVAMGLFRDRIMATLRPWASWLTLGATIIVVYSFLMVTLWRFGPDGKQAADMLWRLVGSVDKWSLDGARFTAIIAASWLVAGPLAGPLERLARTRAGRAMGVIGRGGLFAFVLCVLLSVLGDAMDMTPPDAGPFRRLAVDLWVIAVLWLGTRAWLRRPSMASLKLHVQQPVARN